MAISLPQAKEIKSTENRQNTNNSYKPNLKNITKDLSIPAEAKNKL
jgi:ribosomal protein S20